MTRQRLSHEVLSFAAFMHRSKVLRLYREMLRVSRRIDGRDGQKDGLTTRIRTEFKDQMHVVEKEKRITYMAHAQLQLKQLHSMEITLGRREEDAGETDHESETDVASNMGSGWPWEEEEK